MAGESVVEADFYNAASLLPLSDEQARPPGPRRAGRSGRMRGAPRAMPAGLGRGVSCPPFLKLISYGGAGCAA